VNETPEKVPDRPRPSTASSGSASGTVRRSGNTYSIVRPVIRVMTSRVEVSRAGRPVATVRPSLRTVIRSPIWRISSRRWEM
jgi:hypothetical protein